MSWFLKVCFSKRGSTCTGRYFEVESVYGKGVQLVIPTPGFAAKTSDKTKGDKVFINVCHTDKCEVGLYK
jgi:hypothetical protein